MKLLEKLPELEALDLSFCDEDVEESSLRLPFLPKLRGLDLTGVTRFRGEGLENIPQIEELAIAQTSVTDNCIDRLANLKKLRVLLITGTLMSDEVVAKLKQSLPNCEILHPSLGYK